MSALFDTPSDNTKSNQSGAFGPFQTDEQHEWDLRNGFIFNGGGGGGGGGSGTIVNGLNLNGGSDEGIFSGLSMVNTIMNFRSLYAGTGINFTGSNANQITINTIPGTYNYEEEWEAFIIPTVTDTLRRVYPSVNAAVLAGLTRIYILQDTTISVSVVLTAPKYHIKIANNVVLLCSVVNAFNVANPALISLTIEGGSIFGNGANVFNELNTLIVRNTICGGLMLIANPIFTLNATCTFDSCKYAFIGYLGNLSDITKSLSLSIIQCTTNGPNSEVNISTLSNLNLNITNSTFDLFLTNINVSFISGIISNNDFSTLFQIKANQIGDGNLPLIITNNKFSSIDLELFTSIISPPIGISNVVISQNTNISNLILTSKILANVKILGNQIGGNITGWQLLNSVEICNNYIGGTLSDSLYSVPLSTHDDNLINNNILSELNFNFQGAVRTIISNNYLSGPIFLLSSGNCQISNNTCDQLILANDSLNDCINDNRIVTNASITGSDVGTTYSGNSLPIIGGTSAQFYVSTITNATPVILNSSSLFEPRTTYDVMRSKIIKGGSGITVSNPSAGVVEIASNITYPQRYLFNPGVATFYNGTILTQSSAMVVLSIFANGVAQCWQSIFPTFIPGQTVNLRTKITNANNGVLNSPYTFKSSVIDTTSIALPINSQTIAIASSGSAAVYSTQTFVLTQASIPWVNDKPIALTMEAIAGPYQNVFITWEIFFT